MGMDSIIITWRELLLVVAVFLAVYIAEMLLLLRRGGNPGWRRWQRGAQANAHTRALAELRAQIDALRLELGQLRARVDLPEAAAQRAAMAVAAANDRASATDLPPAGLASGTGPDTGPFRAGQVEAGSPYAQAIHMAREGRAVSEVASDCSISRGEAELIVALYRQTPAH